MAIYTRTGDKGTTSLYGGMRLSKADVQIEAYGTLDELTSILGVLNLHISDEDEVQFIKELQSDLYVIMGFLAGAPTSFEKLKNKSFLFEKKIDDLTDKLPPLRDFIIPGGSAASCWAHMARVNCRKAERVIILYFEGKRIIEKDDSQVILKYLNRLSDLFFTYARTFNNENDVLSKKL